MRFESKDFMKSHRQWHDSRVSKKNCDQNSNAVVKEIQNINGCVGSGDRSMTLVDACYDHSRASPKENNNSYANNEEARDDGDSHKIERKGDGSNKPDLHDSLVPTDFSRKELEQLARSKEKRTQERVLIAQEKATKMNAYEQYTEEFRSRSVEAFMTAQDKVKKSNREKGIESSIELDDLLFYMLPSHTWIGNIFNDSQDAVNKIQKRMLVDYSRNNA